LIWGRKPKGLRKKATEVKRRDPNIRIPDGRETGSFIKPGGGGEKPTSHKNEKKNEEGKSGHGNTTVVRGAWVQGPFDGQGNGPSSRAQRSLE